MGAPVGNTNATKSKPFEHQLRAALAQNDYKSLRKIAEVAIAQAEAGEQWAIQFVADRLDGKAKQQTELTGAEGKDLTIILAEADKSL